MSRRHLVLLLWAATASAALYVYLFDRSLLQRAASALAGAPPLWAYALYLFFGCLRGFTLVPATYLVVAGMLVLPPVPLYLLTLAGIVVSSAAVYLFARSWARPVLRTALHPQVARLRDVLSRKNFYRGGMEFSRSLPPT
jgi:uncharacterized membrane protein YdjX (TVP38/TMEM64 family)